MKYEIKIKQFVFTNDAETLMVCNTKKEANEWLKLFKGCPKYQSHELYIVSK